MKPDNPNYLPIIVALGIGLMILIAILIGLCLWRRKKDDVPKVKPDIES
jgi:LPXTG-motif cell wall-anchored protein